MRGDPYMPLRPADGLQAIGQVLDIRVEDPRIHPDAKQIPFLLTSRGAEARSENLPLRPWVVYVPESPRWRGDDYVPANQYGKGVTVFFSGDYYQSLSAVLANESPTAAPEKWEVVAVPACISRPVEQMAYAEWLKGQGQTEKAMIEQQIAEGELYKAMDAFVSTNGQHLQYLRRGV